MDRLHDTTDRPGRSNLRGLYRETERAWADHPVMTVALARREIAWRRGEIPSRTREIRLLRTILAAAPAARQAVARAQ